jgi:hypothetical protein
MMNCMHVLVRTTQCGIHLTHKLIYWNIPSHLKYLPKWEHQTLVGQYCCASAWLSWIFYIILYFLLWYTNLVEMRADVGTCSLQVSTHRCCVRTNTSDLNKGMATWCHVNMHSSGKLRGMRTIPIQSQFRVRAWQMRSSTRELSHKYGILVRTGFFRQSVSHSVYQTHHLHQAVVDVSQTCIECSSVFYLEVSAVELCQNKVCQG